MVRDARRRLATAHIPNYAHASAVEASPFADKTFDSMGATLVFGFVVDPMRGFRKIKPVLKPGGTLLLLEPVRAQGALAAGVQDTLVPLTTRLSGNCQAIRKALTSPGLRE